MGVSQKSAIQNMITINSDRQISFTALRARDIGEAANQTMVIAPALAQTNPTAWTRLRSVYAMRNAKP